jgi:hypothetical protein
MTNPAPDNIRIKPPAALATLVLAAILAIPAIATFSTDHLARSSWEKRPLAEFPLLSDHREKSYFAELENFIDDHIGLALELNQAYRKLKFYVYRDSPLANIVVGDDGFVFLSSHDATSPYAIFESLCVEKTRLPLVRRIRFGVSSIALGVLTMDLRPSFAIFPSKPVLYPDKLPNSLPQKFRQACTGFASRPNLPGVLAKEWPDYIYYPLAEFQTLKNQLAFYPPENFHANGKSAHEFARGFLATIDIEVGADFDAGRTKNMTEADLKVLGFTRQVEAWSYPYSSYGVVKDNQQPEWVKRYYPRATDFAHYKTQTPASQRVALVLSNSFGVFVAPHLAPGFEEIYHININHLAAENTQALLAAMLDKYAFTDVIFLMHDGSLMNGFKFDQLTLGLGGILRDTAPK